MGTALWVRTCSLQAVSDDKQLLSVLLKTPRRKLLKKKELGIISVFPIVDQVVKKHAIKKRCKLMEKLEILIANTQEVVTIEELKMNCASETNTESIEHRI